MFAPAAEGVYPDGEPAVTVDPGPLGTVLEGAVRPGHFRGVLTVVLKLLQITAADVTLFGEKDYQQLTLVRRMVRDLDLPVGSYGVPDGPRGRRGGPVQPQPLPVSRRGARGGRGPPGGAGRGRRRPPTLGRSARRRRWVPRSWTLIAWG